jgi:MFS family permease
MRSSLSKDEARLVLATSGAYALRTVGLNMALPVLAAWVATFPGATPLAIGLSVGAYGLTQAIFQIPFGVLGDVAGRRIAITLTFVVFAAGSAIVASAQSVAAVIAGRLVQGAAAISSSMIAVIGDATRESVRTRAMAVLGIFLGASFAAGFLTGPLVVARFGTPAIFWIMCVLSLVGAVVFEAGIPARLLARGIARGGASGASAPRADGAVLHAQPTWSLREARALLRSRPLLVLDGGIFALHACLTGLFVVAPLLLAQHLAVGDLWRVYAPLLALGIVTMLWAANVGEDSSRVPALLRAGAAALGAGLASLALFGASLPLIVASLALFIFGFAILEPVLAAHLTRFISPRSRGTAAGVYAQSQFLGAFAGGTLAGALYGHAAWAPFAALAALPIAWLFTLRWLGEPALASEEREGGDATQAGISGPG